MKLTESGLITLGDGWPVNDVVERGDVFRATILITQVVGMFPDVEAQKWRIAVHQRAVLIAAALDDQFLFQGHTQPGPATAEAGQRSFGERFLEGFDAA